MSSVELVLTLALAILGAVFMIQNYLFVKSMKMQHEMTVKLVKLIKEKDQNEAKYTRSVQEAVNGCLDELRNYK